MYMSSRSLYTSCIYTFSYFVITWILKLVPFGSHSSSSPDYYHLSGTTIYHTVYVYHLTAYYSYVNYIVLDPIAHGLVPITWSLWVSGWKGSETRSALQVLGKGTLYLLWHGSHRRCCCLVSSKTHISRVLFEYIKWSDFPLTVTHMHVHVYVNYCHEIYNGAKQRTIVLQEEILMWISLPVFVSVITCNHPWIQ